MTRNDLVRLVFSVAQLDDSFTLMERGLSGLTKAQLTEILLQCGIIPEIIDHDSTEEKLWSKATDCILSKTLNLVGLTTEVIRARADSADVEGRGTGYTIVGDAKAFRISRTAKNQKDFKVEALDKWRKGKDYAVLVSPLFQYPNTTSQIYSQAINRNVTLLSYTHLKFILDNYNRHDLTELWQVGTYLSTRINDADKKKAKPYWNAINNKVCSILGKDIGELNTYMTAEINKAKELGRQELEYWTSRKTAINEMPRTEAITELVKALKIDSKMSVIQGAIDSL